MSLDDKVHAALRSLIENGVVVEVHTNRHAHYVRGGAIPDEVNVLAVLNAQDPEEHRAILEDLLHGAGFGKVVLHLHGEATMPNACSEDTAAQVGPDPIRMNKTRVRERAYLLWEAEGSPAGRLDEYWDRACELIEDESQSSYPPAQSRGHRT